MIIAAIMAKIVVKMQRARKYTCMLSLYDILPKVRSPPTYMIKLCDWSIMTIEDKNHLSKERVMNTDHFCFRKPVTKLVHIR